MSGPCARTDVCKGVHKHTRGQGFDRQQPRALSLLSSLSKSLTNTSSRTQLRLCKARVQVTRVCSLSCSTETIRYCAPLQPTFHSCSRTRNGRRNDCRSGTQPCAGTGVASLYCGMVVHSEDDVPYGPSHPVTTHRGKHRASVSESCIQPQYQNSSCQIFDGQCHSMPSASIMRLASSGSNTESSPAHQQKRRFMMKKSWSSMDCTVAAM